MYVSQASAAVNAAVANIKTDLPTIEVKHYAQAGAGLARIVARVIHTGASRANRALIGEALSKKFDGKMTAVAGSINVVDSGPLDETITGVVSIVRDSLALASDADLSGFRAVASNMYLDDEDRMWSLSKTEAGRLMVRSTGIDDDQALIGMLHAVASAAPTVRASQQLAAIASATASNVQAGSLVTYVNGNNQVALGFVVVASAEGDTAVVLPHHAQDSEGETISVNAVVDVVPDSAIELPALSEEERMGISLASSRGAVSIESMLDYYRRVFGHRPDFYDQFAARIKAHAFG